MKEAITQSPQETTFDIFVKHAILKIQREAWGRSTDLLEVRNACQTLLDAISEDKSFEVPLDSIKTKEVLKPLKLACNCNIVRVVEPAINCIHKMVAYAWIQGESSSAGERSDGTIVTEVINMIIQCVNLENTSIYLAVVKTLLTFCTAEHFQSHGYCLLQMIRTVFNLAISCDDSNLKRTSCNALLQMVNTIIKRVITAQYNLKSQESKENIILSAHNISSEQNNNNEKQEEEMHENKIFQNISNKDEGNFWSLGQTTNTNFIPREIINMATFKYGRKSRY